MLVVDASVASAACVAHDGFVTLGDELVAPPLMWSEVRSGLHLKMAKAELTVARAEAMHGRLIAAPVQPTSPDELGRRAWALATEFGLGADLRRRVRRAGSDLGMPGRHHRHALAARR